MRPVSDAFLRSLKGTHKFVTRATLCPVFQTGVQPVGTRYGIVDGSCTLDGKASVRGSIDITIQGQWPTVNDAALAPYGTELFIERGIEYDPGNVEYVGLGYFRLDTVEGVDTDGYFSHITAYDRMQAIVEGYVTEPQQFFSTQTLASVFDTLIMEIYPDATIEWDDDTDEELLGRDMICEDDRFAFLDDIVTAHSKIWYWDHRGILVITAVPDPMRPVYEVRHGKHGVLVSMNRSLTRTGAYNAVIALGEAPDTRDPVRAIAVDLNPASATYFYGQSETTGQTFGKVPKFYSSQALTTELQCQNAADAELSKILGLPYTADFGTIVNPALEPWDPVLVKQSHREAWRIHVLDTVNIPFSHGQPLTATTREQRITIV